MVGAFSEQPLSGFSADVENLNHFIQKFGHQMSDCAEVSQSELQP
jgi:hypothetical protein